MANNEIQEMIEGFDTLGEFIHELFNSDASMYFITLLIICVLFSNILKMLISKIPMFEGEGDRKVNTYGNVTAWCISLLSIVSIGWQTKDQGMDSVIMGLAGPYGVFLVLALSVTLGYGLWKSFEDSAKWTRISWAIVPSGALYFWMMGYITKQGGMFWIFAIIISLAFISGLLTHLTKD